MFRAYFRGVLQRICGGFLVQLRCSSLYYSRGAAWVAEVVTALVAAAVRDPSQPPLQLPMQPHVIRLRFPCSSVTASVAVYTSAPAQDVPLVVGVLETCIVTW